jgi:hypothetical protein
MIRTEVWGVLVAMAIGGNTIEISSLISVEANIIESLCGKKMVKMEHRHFTPSRI